jgi:hypothetical protein
MYIGKITLYPLRLTAICNSPTNVSISSIVAHKVQKNFNASPSVQLYRLMKRKCTHVRDTLLLAKELDKNTLKNGQCVKLVGALCV